MDRRSRGTRYNGRWIILDSFNQPTQKKLSLCRFARRERVQSFFWFHLAHEGFNLVEQCIYFCQVDFKLRRHGNRSPRFTGTSIVPSAVLGCKQTIAKKLPVTGSVIKGFAVGSRCGNSRLAPKL